MKQNETVTSNAVDHVDPQRRGFLAKMLAGSVALPVMSSMALGETPQTGKGKGGKGKGGGGKGKGGAAGKGKGGAGKGQQGGGADRDPAEFAKRLIQQFDKDGDKALNEAELTAALKSMRERRGSMEAGAGAQGKGKGGAGKGKGGAGKGQPSAGGGVKPKKPGE